MAEMNLHEHKQTLRSRSDSDYVRLRDLYPIIESLEELMEASDATAAAEAQLESDVTAAEAAGKQEMADVKDELAKLTAQLPNPAMAQALTDKLNALDKRIQGDTAAVVKADPGPQGATAAAPTGTGSEAPAGTATQGGVQASAPAGEPGQQAPLTPAADPSQAKPPEGAPSA